MINIIQRLLSNRKQRVDTDVRYSDWAAEVQAGVPQGSLPGPLQCLMYMIDLVEVVDSKLI